MQGTAQAGQATQTAPPAPSAPAGTQVRVIQVPIPSIPGAPQGPIGTATTQAPWTPPSSANDIPPEIVPILGIVMTSVVTIVLGYPIIRLITRMIDRRSDRALVPAADVQAQLKALQQSMDAMAIEVERISEAQRFQAKLLSQGVVGMKELPRA